MRQLTLKKIGKKLTEEDISSVEKEAGIIFPKTYSKFLIEYNGGEIDSNIKTTKEGYNFGIRNFFRIEDRSVRTSLLNMFQAVNEMFENTNNWLPFGEDAGDWVFCICLKEDKYGEIYIMRTDEIDEYDAFIFVCDSFDKFIDDLEPHAVSVASIPLENL